MTSYDNVTHEKGWKIEVASRGIELIKVFEMFERRLVPLLWLKSFCRLCVVAWP